MAALPWTAATIMHALPPLFDRHWTKIMSPLQASSEIVAYMSFDPVYANVVMARRIPSDSHFVWSCDVLESCDGWKGQKSSQPSLPLTSQTWLLLYSEYATQQCRFQPEKIAKTVYLSRPPQAPPGCSRFSAFDFPTERESGKSDFRGRIGCTINLKLVAQ